MIPKYKLEKSFNPEQFNELCIDKLKTYSFFSEINQPNTLEFSKKNLMVFFETQDIALLKPRYLKKGEGIFLLEKTDNIPELKDYIIQEFIDNGFENYYFDIRVYVQNFNELIIVPYARISKKIISNLAQGGKVDDAKLLLDILFPNENKLNQILDIVKKIIKKIRFKETGIDFIVDKTGKIYLIELNSFPEILGLFILKNPDDSIYENFTIKYDINYKKNHEKLLDKIRKNRYEELKCVV